MAGSALPVLPPDRRRLSPRPGSSRTSVSGRLGSPGPENPERSLQLAVVSRTVMVPACRLRAVGGRLGRAGARADDPILSVVPVPILPTGAGQGWSGREGDGSGGNVLWNCISLIDDAACADCRPWCISAICLPHHFCTANVEFADASDAEVRKVVGLGANSLAVQGIRRLRARPSNGQTTPTGRPTSPPSPR
jgi:hypothetical protein